MDSLQPDTREKRKRKKRQRERRFRSDEMESHSRGASLSLKTQHTRPPPASLRRRGYSLLRRMFRRCRSVARPPPASLRRRGNSLPRRMPERPDVPEIPVGDEILEISPQNRAGAMISLSLGKYSRPPRLPPTPSRRYDNGRRWIWQSLGLYLVHRQIHSVKYVIGRINSSGLFGEICRYAPG